ncbi:hypothetical protein V9T40_013771 [Parthenolecanium corni]|uniref:Eukaryotic translation initiation factor 5 n=1 Tax=Parthenolecanium corni TaxID=536013 RepID=A0AAN9Y2X9_9HEMI
MGSLNVNRNVSDPFYRYKMPKIIAKVEGKGNGIKTVIVNMSEVAKAIGRPPTYPTKYFGCELGAQTQFDFKNDRFIVNGSHEANKLQDLLDGFIRKFVLCPDCDNPETNLVVSTKKGTICRSCKACGFHGPLEFNHKLNTFILKNPPNLNPAAQGSSLTEGKRAKRSKKQGDVNGDRSGSPNSDEVDGEIEVPDPKTKKDDDDDWALDVSEEAVRARMQDLTEGAKGLTINDDLEKSEKERVDLLYAKVKADRDAGALNAKEIVAEAERLDIKSKAPLILAELLFDDKIAVQLKKHKELLLRTVHNDEKAQKYLLGGIEQVIGLHKEALMPKVPGILKWMYDNDVLDENVVLDWASKVSKKFVSRELNQEIHKAADPFVKWLKEAEEEEDSGESDEDDVEIEYNDRPNAVTLKLQPTPVKPNANNSEVKEDSEDDVDIDAI